MKIFAFAIILIAFSCQNTQQSDSVSLNTLEIKNETLVASDTTDKEETTSCKPIITPTTTTLENRFAFQVKGFAATDKSCWEAIKNHGIIFCQNKFPCRLTYIENDHLGVDKNNPSYPDWNTLKKYGIADFTKFKGSAGWQLAGADSMVWGRNQEGFDYFDDKANY